MKVRKIRLPLFALAVLFLLPAVRTALAVRMEIMPAVLYPLFQVLMIALPIWVWAKRGMSRRDVFESVGLKRTSTLGGVVIGLLMAGTIIAGYYTMFRSIIDPSLVLDKVQSLGLLKWYWVMAVVMSLWNSLYEEYYWRAFLVSELGKWTKSTLIICAIAGSLFGLHHLFVLISLFELPMALLFTFGTAGAGIVWTWMRRRGYSIWDCYISHILADLAIFWIGYDLIQKAS